MPGSDRLLVACLAVLFTGCAPDAAPGSGAPAGTAPAAGTVAKDADVAAGGAMVDAGHAGAPHAGGPDGHTEPLSPEPDVAGFDPRTLPVSTQPLGDFPFFSLPDGHRAVKPRTYEFGEAAFWTGSGITHVEGRVHATGVRRDRKAGDSAFSDLEVVRNLEAVVLAAGGVEISAGEVPQPLRKPLADAMRSHDIEATCYAHSPQQVFVIRRSEGNVWVRTCRGQTYAGLVVAQEHALEVTSALLPASAIGQALADDGRVALEVHFATDRAEILEDSRPQIAEVAELLDADPGLSLSIEGHTDSTGTAARNRELSQARAAAVVAALTATGIAPGRLEAAGLGDSQPVADNATEAGRARNRRVELVRRD